MKRKLCVDLVQIIRFMVCSLFSLFKLLFIALGYDGTYHKYAFAMPTAQSNEISCNRVAFDLFLDLGDDQNFWNV
jgi:hypothetical protein